MAKEVFKAVRNTALIAVLFLMFICMFAGGIAASALFMNGGWS